MVLKKINAVIGLLAAVILLIHNAVNSNMMMQGRVDESPFVFAAAVACLAGLHAIVSLFMVFGKHDGLSVEYSGLYRGMTIQRLTGIIMIPLVLFHVFVRAGQYGIGLIPILIVHFFIMLLAFWHIPLSVPNALVTLGIIDSSKAYKRVRIACFIICIASGLLGVAASITEVVQL